MVSKYKNLDKFLEKKGKKVKRKESKKKSKLNGKEMNELLMKMLQDFGYIE